MSKRKVAKKKLIYIIRNFETLREYNYLCWMSSNDFDMTEEYQKFRGYFWGDLETYKRNLPNHSSKHPTYFKTCDDAEKFISWVKAFEKHTGTYSIHPYGMYIDSMIISFPGCDMDCWKCNKRNKFNCKNLLNPYQNLCSFKMCQLPEDYTINPNRLDAPCEVCLTKPCVMNYN